MIARGPLARAKPGRPASNATTVRVAAYARQSVSKDGDPEFGSIEAQHEAVAAYVTVRKADGWVLLPTDYSDLGVSGKSIERPGFRRLLDDVEAGQVDCIATYKIDRLSRSLPDFTRLMQYFAEHGVTFVSTTQSIDTSTSSGKLMLNVLASFAEYEREAVSERVYDKLIASRRRGLWTGGHPPLGYDVIDRQLVVNPAEAEQVRETFALYLNLGSLREVAEVLNRRGLTTKSWVNRRGERVAGRPWAKNSLCHLLRSALVVGKVHAEGELHAGQHKAIVDQPTWDAVGSQLAAHRPETRPERPRSKTGALLQGLLRCGQCGAAMGPHSTRQHGRQYVSYVCATVQKQGAAACPGSRAASHEVDAFVVGRLQALGNDPELQAATVAAAREAQRSRLAELRAAIAEAKGDPAATQALKAEARALKGAALREADLRAALRSFVPVWDALFPAERARVLGLLIERVEYHAQRGELTIRYRPGGIRTLANS